MNNKVFNIALYALALINLGILTWSVQIAVRQPDPGLEWSFSSGIVSSVDPYSQFSRLIQPGDVILSIDGKSAYDSRGLPGKRPGDIVELIVRHDMNNRLVRIKLAEPTSHVIWTRILIFIVALMFWLPSLLALAYSQFDRIVVLFFLFCQGMSIILGLGTISSYAISLWASWSFRLFVWWIAPLGVYFHISFLYLPNSLQKTKFIFSLFFTAAILSSLNIIDIFLGHQDWLRDIRYWWVGINFIVIIVIIINRSSKLNPSDIQHRLWSIYLGGFVGLFPFIFLSLLPDVLIGRPFLSYDITFIALSFIPIGYGYGVLRHPSFHFEHYINRVAVYVVSMLIIMAIYMFIYWGGSLITLNTEWNFGATIIVILVFPPLYQTIQRASKKVFYGEWWSAQQAVERIQLSSKQYGSSIEKLAVVFCETLQKTLLLENVQLCLSNGKVITIGRKGSQTGQQINPENTEKMLSAFRIEHKKEFGWTNSGFQLPYLSPEEEKNILGERQQAWILLVGAFGIIGLVILGARRGGGLFDARDLEILDAIVRQAQLALENAILFAEGEKRAHQIQSLNHQVLLVRESEKKRLARELHDQAIQSLIGLNYKLSKFIHVLSGNPQRELQDIRTEVQNNIKSLRQICSDLRPPALDTIGLAAALQSRVDELYNKVPFRIDLKITGNPEIVICDDVAICLYRVFQEALLNVKKHSGANYVKVSLDLSEKKVELKVQDNGKGFSIPVKLTDFAEDQHFGLIGFNELMESINGVLSVESSPGHGCTVCAVASPQISEGEKATKENYAN
jgi:signal transduction histidine kinase